MVDEEDVLAGEVLPHPDAAAREMRLDGMLAEAGGAAPAPDLEQRIVAVLRSEGARPRRSVWSWAAALLVAGLAVVAAVAFDTGEGDRQGAAPAPDSIQGSQEPQEPQDPQDPQDPEIDPETVRTVTRLIRELEIPDKRSAVLLQLAGIGRDAVPLLEKALTEERPRGRDDVVRALLAALQAATVGEAKAKMGWPVDTPVTLIADYSDNLVAAVGLDGREIWSLEEVFGAFDVELTAAGTLLITEFSVSRVQEIDKDGQVLWKYDGLKNPYDADRLPDGNTLIADTFGGRVIEVDPAGKIVWSYAAGVRPFDADRLPNGNTLIADVSKGRVIEVSPAGEVVWEVPGMPNVHDADRLPNGNTLITLRTVNRVVEVDGDGEVVWELPNLVSPSDADRLPDGTTLVAENLMVRAFDAAGKEIWKAPMQWAVEVNRY